MKQVLLLSDFIWKTTRVLGAIYDHLILLGSSNNSQENNCTSSGNRIKKGVYFCGRGHIRVDLYDLRAIHISMAFTVAHKYNFWYTSVRLPQQWKLNRNEDIQRWVKVCQMNPKPMDIKICKFLASGLATPPPWRVLNFGLTSQLVAIVKSLPLESFLFTFCHICMALQRKFLQFRCTCKEGNRNWKNPNNLHRVWPFFFACKKGKTFTNATEQLAFFFWVFLQLNHKDEM